MTFPPEQPDDQRLSRYLLGSLADAEADALDELSVADEQIASRLSAVEHDLVDAYVKGELSGETLDRFRSRYLSSPVGIRKVRLAEALFEYQTQHTAPVAHRSGSAARMRTFAWPHNVPQWAMAAAALLVLTVGAVLVIDNLRLRREIAQSASART